MKRKNESRDALFERKQFRITAENKFTRIKFDLYSENNRPLIQQWIPIWAYVPAEEMNFA